MPKPAIKYHVPPFWAWNWSVISENYVRYEHKRALQSLEDLAKDEARLDADVQGIEQEIRGAFASANATMMRAFEVRLRASLAERKRLNGIGKRLDAALKAIHDIGVRRGWVL